MHRVLLFLMIFLLSTGVVSANEVLDGENCTVTPDEIITDNVFVLCGELRVEGRIEGHLIGAARTVTITGSVEGSIYLAAVELNMNGQVGKDIHFAGLALTIDEQTQFEHAQGGIISLSLSQTITPGAVVPGRITGLGYQLIVQGSVGSDIGFWGSALQISGDVAGNVTATVGNAESNGASSQIETLLIPFPIEVELVDPGLIVSEDARIGGTLDYTGATPGIIEGTIAEATIYQPSGQALIGTVTEPSSRTLRHYLRDVLQEFSTLGFIGVVVMLFIPRQMQAPLYYLRIRPISTLGVGMLTFILSFPVFLVIAFFSIVFMLVLSLLPLDDVVIFGGLALTLANIGGASLFYFTAIYIARLIVALAIGKFILHLLQRDDGTWRALFLNMAIGVFILAVFNSIPTFGWGIDALALFMGLGAILSAFRRMVKRLVDGMPLRTGIYPVSQPDIPLLPPPANYFTDEEVFAAPIIQQNPPPPGTENLPEGFNWWEDKN